MPTAALGIQQAQSPYLLSEPQGPALVALGKASPHASCSGTSRDSSPWRHLERLAFSGEALYRIFLQASGPPG